MVLKYYNLNAQPFGVTPDPAFLFFSRTHREAMASLMYGVLSERGFTTLIAEPGMGKTSLLFNLLRKLKGYANTVFLFQTLCGPQELLRALLADLRLADGGAEIAQMHAELNEYLLRESERGRQLVVVLDEAQNLGADTLEVVRMLSNFETADRKLVHIVLAGQPRLAETLASQNLVQLRQRISFVARLTPFDGEETRQYIDHRLRVAGFRADECLFTERAYARIAEYSRGVPRTINNLCFNAMSLGCASKCRTLDTSIVQEAIDDLDLEQLVRPHGESEGRRGQSNAPLTLPSLAFAKPLWPLYVVLAIAVGSALAWPAYRAAELVRRQVLFQRSHAATQVPTPAGREVAGPSKGLVNGTEGLEATTAQGGTTTDIEIRVKSNESPSSLSKLYAGPFDKRVLDDMKRVLDDTLDLNRWLKDPERIQAGQILRIPVNRQFERKRQSMPESSTVPGGPGQRENR